MTSLCCNRDRLCGAVPHRVITFRLNVVGSLLSWHLPSTLIWRGRSGAEQIVVNVELHLCHGDSVGGRGADGHILIARHSAAVCGIRYGDCEIGARNRVADINRYNRGKASVAGSVIRLCLKRVGAVRRLRRVPKQNVRR